MIWINWISPSLSVIDFKTFFQSSKIYILRLDLDHSVVRWLATTQFDQLRRRPWMSIFANNGTFTARWSRFETFDEVKSRVCMIRIDIILCSMCKESNSRADSSWYFSFALKLFECRKKIWSVCMNIDNWFDNVQFIHEYFDCDWSLINFRELSRSLTSMCIFFLIFGSSWMRANKDFTKMKHDGIEN